MLTTEHSLGKTNNEKFNGSSFHKNLKIIIKRLKTMMKKVSKDTMAEKC